MSGCPADFGHSVAKLSDRSSVQHLPANRGICRSTKATHRSRGQGLENNKTTGQTWSDLWTSGQGRGRTAGLPIFSRTFEEVDTDLPALLTVDCCPRATYFGDCCQESRVTGFRVVLDARL